MERAPVRRSNTMPPNLGNSGILGRASVEERVPGGKGVFIGVTRASLSLSLSLNFLFSFSLQLWICSRLHLVALFVL